MKLIGTVQFYVEKCTLAELQAKVDLLLSHGYTSARILPASHIESGVLFLLRADCEITDEVDNPLIISRTKVKEVTHAKPNDKAVIKN
jgi:hypothetical protein